MGDLSAAVVAQWGGFGCVLVACAVAIWKLYNEVLRQRDDSTKLQKDHASTITGLQNARIADAERVTVKLLSLQQQFNDSVNAMAKQQMEHVRAEDQVFQAVNSLERRLENIERKVLR